MTINAAILDTTGLITNVIVVNELTDVPGAVVLPDGLIIGNKITDAPSLTNYKRTQSVAISTACAYFISGGGISSALGALHTYPTKATDQANLNASVVSSLLPGLPPTWTTPFWCADSTGAWSYVQHTAAQIQQVGTDVKAFIISCQTKNATLQAAIQAATTVEAVQAVVWA